MSIHSHVLCQFFNQVFFWGGGDAELYKFFAYLRYQPLVKYTICKYLLLFSRIPFCFIVSFTVQKLFSLMKSHLLIFTFVFLA